MRCSFNRRNYVPKVRQHFAQPPLSGSPCPCGNGVGYLHPGGQPVLPFTAVPPPHQITSGGVTANECARAKREIELPIRSCVSSRRNCPSRRLIVSIMPKFPQPIGRIGRHASAQPIARQPPVAVVRSVSQWKFDKVAGQLLPRCRVAWAHSGSAWDTGSWPSGCLGWCSLRPIRDISPQP